MYNPFLTHFSVLPFASLTMLLLANSGCSNVQLNYQMPSAVLSNVSAGELIRSQSSPDNVLARLTLNTTLQITPAELAGMRLEFVLKQGNAVIQELAVSAARFLSDPTFVWADLPLGDARLEVKLLDASGTVLGTLQNAFVLTEDGQQQVDFGLFHLAGDGAAQMTLAYSTGVSNPALLPTEQIRFALPSSPSDASSDASDTVNTGGTPSTANPVVGSSDSSLKDLKLRLVESGQTRLLFFWEPPADTEVDSYRLLLEGKLIAEDYLLSNYRVENLLNNTTYALTVQALNKAGAVVAEQTLSAKTGAGASGSGGGGGGGGGGSSSSPVNNPPVIDALTATRTTLPAPGYPVGLQASATDESILPNAAYTWTCEACADATFNTSTGTASSGEGTDVIWNAPSTPGTYTLTLSVSDGVNDPVTQTQVIIVEQRLGTVIVEGTYQ